MSYFKKKSFKSVLESSSCEIFAFQSDCPTSVTLQLFFTASVGSYFYFPFDCASWHILFYVKVPSLVTSITALLILSMRAYTCLHLQSPK